jgi:hypothetical protein
MTENQTQHAITSSTLKNLRIPHAMPINPAPQKTNFDAGPPLAATWSCHHTTRSCREAPWSWGMAAVRFILSHEKHSRNVPSTSAKARGRAASSALSFFAPPSSSFIPPFPSQNLRSQHDVDGHSNYLDINRRFLFCSSFSSSLSSSFVFPLCFPNGRQLRRQCPFGLHVQAV